MSLTRPRVLWPVMNARRLQQPGGLEAGLAGFADHHVVVHGDAELFSRRHDLAGHLDVGLRGRRVARGMIVHHFSDESLVCYGLRYSRISYWKLERILALVYDVPFMCYVFAW